MMKVSNSPQPLRRLLFGLTLFLVILIPLFARADDPSDDQTGSPFFEILSEDASVESFPLESTRVEAKISGIVADVTVTQRYQNRGTQKIEAAYVFPASTKAAIHGLEMKIGDRTIRAEIEEKQSARERFEQARKENKTASLLEQHRPNVFQMNVTNILPGDVIEVKLEYTEHLIPTDRVYSFIYPTVVGPRYAGDPKSPDRSSESWVSNPYLEEGVESPAKFHFNAEISAGLPLSGVKSDTHPLAIEYTAADIAVCELTGSPTSSGNRDLILNYRLDGDRIQSGLLLHEGENPGENFFLLTMQPPARVTEEDEVSREYLFVVDVSGSMNGFPLRTAKSLMSELIGDLSPDDRFNILKFAGGQEVLAAKSLQANEENLNEAIRWMDRSGAGGGTELVSALKHAYRLPGKSEDRARVLVVVTDGYVSFEREAFELVEENLDEASLFAFGIGSSVNRYLIDGMARVGQGEPFVVTDAAESVDIASRFRKYISQPVLTNVRVDFGDFETYDVLPAKVPDLFAERPVTLVGKWRGEPKGEVTITGVAGNGPVEMQSPISHESASEQPALPLLWARERISQLDDYTGKGSMSEDHRQEIVNLGLTYQLMTRFTSFVAVDEVVRESHESDDPVPVNQPLPLPAGVPATAVGGGSTPGPGIIPLLLIGLSALFGKRLRQKKE